MWSAGVFQTIEKPLPSEAKMSFDSLFSSIEVISTTVHATLYVSISYYLKGQIKLESSNSLSKYYFKQCHENTLNKNKNCYNAIRFPLQRLKIIKRLKILFLQQWKYISMYVYCNNNHHQNNKNSFTQTSFQLLEIITCFTSLVVRHAS